MAQPRRQPTSTSRAIQGQQARLCVTRVRHYRQTGQVQAKQRRGYLRPIIDGEHLQLVQRLLEEQSGCPASSIVRAISTAHWYWSERTNDAQSRAKVTHDS